MSEILGSSKVSEYRVREPSLVSQERRGREGPSPARKKGALSLEARWARSLEDGGVCSRAALVVVPQAGPEVVNARERGLEDRVHELEVDGR